VLIAKKALTQKETDVQKNPYIIICVPYSFGLLPWSSSSVLDHGSLPPMFKSRPGHIEGCFIFDFASLTFGGRSAHLTYHVHKSGPKTPVIIITLKVSHIKHVNKL